MTLMTNANGLQKYALDRPFVFSEEMDRLAGLTVNINGDRQRVLLDFLVDWQGTLIEFLATDIIPARTRIELALRLERIPASIFRAFVVRCAKYVRRLVENSTTSAAFDLAEYASRQVINSAVIRDESLYTQMTQLQLHVLSQIKPAANPSPAMRQQGCALQVIAMALSTELDARMALLAVHTFRETYSASTKFNKDQFCVDELLPLLREWQVNELLRSPPAWARPPRRHYSCD